MSEATCVLWVQQVYDFLESSLSFLLEALNEYHGTQSLNSCSGEEEKFLFKIISNKLVSTAIETQVRKRCFTWVKQHSALQVSIFLWAKIQIPQLMQASSQSVDSSKSWLVGLLFRKTRSEQNPSEDT